MEKDLLLNFQFISFNTTDLSNYENQWKISTFAELARKYLKKEKLDEQETGQIITAIHALRSRMPVLYPGRNDLYLLAMERNLQLKRSFELPSLIENDTDTELKAHLISELKIEQTNLKKLEEKLDDEAKDESKKFKKRLLSLDLVLRRLPLRL